MVKTAFFASDPSLGFILADVGHADIVYLHQSLIDVDLDDLDEARQGGRLTGHAEADGQRG